MTGTDLCVNKPVTVPVIFEPPCTYQIASLCSFLHSPFTSSLLGPNTLLNTLFSNTLSLRSSLNVSDQVSHPYKTTGKIIVLYFLIFKFLDSNLEDKRYTRTFQTYLNSYHQTILPCKFFNFTEFYSVDVQLAHQVAFTKERTSDYRRFEVLTAVLLIIRVFWAVTQCRWFQGPRTVEDDGRDKKCAQKCGRETF